MKEKKFGRLMSGLFLVCILGNRNLVDRNTGEIIMFSLK